MPKIHHVKAAKAYPEHGIAKGDLYYHWSFFRGPKQMSKTAPRRSQTTASPNLSAAYACEESFQDDCASAKTPEDLATACDDAMNAADEVIEQFDETISNLGDAFQGGCPAIDEAQEKRDAVEAWREEIEAAKSEIEAMDPSEFADSGAEGVDFAALDEEERAAMMEAAREHVDSLSLEA
jgi:hypothetical protein